MRLIKHQTFICLDCETTGLDPAKDRIIEVAAIKFTIDDMLAEYETLIDPEIPIPAQSVAIHHITEEMVKGKPPIQNILTPLFEFIGPYPLIGHGIQFDIDILYNQALQHKVSTGIKKNAFYDTLRLARLYGDSPSNSLETLRRHFNIEDEGAHRAMSDCVVNIQVFKKLLINFKTMEQLDQVLAKPIQMKYMPLGKHKGRPMKELPFNYLLWAANQDFDQDLLFSLRSEINRRKKGSGFSQATSPFVNL